LTAATHLTPKLPPAGRGAAVVADEGSVNCAVMKQRHIKLYQRLSLIILLKENLLFAGKAAAVVGNKTGKEEESS